MRRYLVVGCGGSGGKALAYLMDQLRSDLGRHGVHRLPGGWQFVNIDVPTVSENGPDGLGSVQAQGGTYIGCAPSGTNYPVLDAVVSRTLHHNGKALHGIATWAPRGPRRVNQPITAGAGQYRALGRMITLSRAHEIREQLQHTWDRLMGAPAAADMSRLAIPGMGAYNPSTPVVIVVSSMAGGAGASMALDVCRLLSEVRGLDTSLMGMFMVAPNVFDRLEASARTGVRPNALAMLGEIVASQVGAASEHDLEVLEALGVDLAERTIYPFARVFPVGRFSGIDRMQFGDGSPETVYRGLARGLAALMTSETASDKFVQYDLANRASKPGNQQLLGWGAEWANIPWGSYGFASLSMGRDRYAEYAGQRVAASCVDRLLRGHTAPGSRASSIEQVNTLIGHQWGPTCLRAGFPAQAGDVDGWFRGVAFPGATVAAEAAAIATAELRPYLPEGNGVQADVWVSALRHTMTTRAHPMELGAFNAAKRLAFDWHLLMSRKVQAEVGRTVAANGLPYAGALADQLAAYLRDTVATGLDRIVAASKPPLNVLPTQVETSLAKLKGTVTVGPLITEKVLEGSRKNLAAHVESYAAGFAAYLLREFAVQVLGPLREALAAAQRILENEEAASPTDVGLARLTTEEVAAWPKDADPRVPSRFDEANNEVLLTSTATFPAQYEGDLRHALGGERAATFQDAREQVAAKVVLGEWTSAGGDRPPGGLLETVREWRSSTFQQDPHDPEGVPIAPSKAGFDVHVRPAELLARARLFVARPGESFDRFCSVPIKSFVSGDDVGEAGRPQREKEIVTRFTEALTLARPLISVNQHALKEVHPDEPGIEYRYKFSDVPLRNLPIVEDLARVLTDNPMIDQPTRDNFASAVTDTDGITRIDIFGSYPNYSPLVFDAVLQPVTEQWTRLAGDESRDEFWQWRRSRPLAAALPMTDLERRAMVAGWLLGRLTGRIRRLPSKPYDRPVEIWDPEIGQWAPFPHPLLTPPRAFKAPYDWLPAVLESVLLAIARTHRSPAMSSLRPYQLLRCLYDSSTTGAGGVMNELAARRLVRDWLRGSLPEPNRSTISTIVDAATVDERAAAAFSWLDDTRQLAGKHYMKSGGDAPGGGDYSVVPDRTYAAATPIFRDIAPDVFWATGELRRIVEEELPAAHEKDPPEPPEPSMPATPEPRVPDGEV